MKIGQRSLLGYLPAQVIKCVLDGTISQKPRYPLEIPLNTVSLFADISGFTKLSEKFSKFIYFIFHAFLYFFEDSHIDRIF